MIEETTEKTANATESKDRVPQLDRIVKLDNCFRDKNPAKCTMEAILEAFENDKEIGAISRSTFYNYVQMFRDTFGAEFKGKEISTLRKSKRTASGKKPKNKLYTFSHERWNRKTIYQYVDSDAPLPELQKLLGKVRQDSGVALLKALENEERENISTPLHIWLRLFLERMINEKSPSLDVVSFYENIDLDVRNIHKFERLLQAILKKQPLQLHYINKMGYQNDPCVLPYRLKNYNQRWYLIGKCYNPDPRPKHPDEFYEGYSNYALDGIVDLVDIDGVTVLKPAIQDWDYEYIEPDEDELNDFYYDMVGVTETLEGPQDVYLSFTPSRYVYVESKPIVGSQSRRPIGEEDKHYRPGRVTIKLRAHLNRELEQQILSFGPDCEVVAPESFRDQVRGKIAAMVALYDEQTKQ